MRITILLFMTAATALLSADEKPTPSPATDKHVTAEMQRDYFQSVSAVLQTQTTLKAAQQALDASVTRMQTLCGGPDKVVFDAKGLPDCAPATADSLKPKE